MPKATLNDEVKWPAMATRRLSVLSRLGRAAVSPLRQALQPVLGAQLCLQRRLAGQAGPILARFWGELSGIWGTNQSWSPCCTFFQSPGSFQFIGNLFFNRVNVKNGVVRRGLLSVNVLYLQNCTGQKW